MMTLLSWCLFTQRVERLARLSLKSRCDFKIIFAVFSLSMTACIPPPSPPEMHSSLLEGIEEDGEMMLEVNAGEMSERTLDERVEFSSCQESHLSQSSVREWTGVVYELRFAREEPDGISLGHDIDGRVSDAGDAESCFRADLTSPDGVNGIDNQFSQILPLIEAVGGEAIEGLAQGVINQGRLLLMLRITALDDLSLMNDDCVHFESFYGQGVPQIGTQGYIVTGQTFDRDHERPSTRTEGLRLDQRGLEVSGLSLELPLEVFDQSYLFELSRVSINGFFNEEGEFHGFISAALDVEAVARRVEMIDGGGMITELIPRFLRQQADLSPHAEGGCQELSMTLTFKARQSFLFPENEEGGAKE